MQRGALFIIFLFATMVRAADPSAPASPSARGQPLHGVVSSGKEGKSSKHFLSGTPKIFGLWKGETLKAGDVVRAVWIAESFGARQKDVKITESEMTAYKPDDDGIFALLRPEGGWPIGRYRLEFYVRDRLADTVRFSIEQDVTVEVR